MTLANGVRVNKQVRASGATKVGSPCATVFEPLSSVGAPQLSPPPSLAEGPLTISRSHRARWTIATDS
jgi:hypothetical protein